jgi:isoleucyl-tRNA synthetase
MKVLLGHAQVRDEKGEEMHKSKGNAIPFEEAVEKMSADLMRWMFCRHNPANNINFGYGPADEIRNKFVLKLWNTYAFFCNYARLDGFDPSAPQVPIKDRPDIDRWILSDLQILIQTARREFERFNVQGFCLKAEEFVDDKLSNWYVRRNRRRFWKSEQTADKQAAYQTLYTVLTTLAKLFAPIMPFLTESIYQNLTLSGGRQPPEPSSYQESVHHCDFPEVDQSLMDEELSADMDTLLWLVSLGSAARNSKKIKVRQPLAEMKVEGDERIRKTIERFADQIREELNIKRITFHDRREGSLANEKPQLDMQLIGPKHGQHVSGLVNAFSKADPLAVVAKKRAGEPYPLVCPWGTELLFPAEVKVELVPPDGWSVEYDAGVVLIIDCRITNDLKREGLAREVVRHVQNARKDAGLEMEDRIVLYLHTESKELREAIEAHKEYISRETLTVKWATQPLGEGAHRVTVKVDGQPLTIELRKIP